MKTENAQNENLTYYQFQKEIDFSLFVKASTVVLSEALKQTLKNVGFEEISAKEFKEKDLQRYKTKILTIKEANHKVARQISQSFLGMEKYGSENLTSQGNYEVYRFKNVGMMVFSQMTYEWELGLINTENNLEETRVMLTRFITWALVEQGILAFWGIPVEEGLVVMSQKESAGEAVFIDMENNKIITQEGTKKLPAYLQILRLDSTLKSQTKVMSPEELLSFLTTNVSFFTVSNLPYELMRNIRNLVLFSEGIIYPQENFEPRSEAA